MSEIGELAAALAAAQAEMSNAAFNKVNPHFKSRYADLASVRDATLASLNKHGLALTQYTSVREDGMVLLHTELMHSKSNQFITSAWPIPQGTAQQMGSALTYARRYSWAGICAIASEEDDDANLASAPLKKSAYQARNEGDYEKMMAEIKAQPSMEALARWWTANTQNYRALPDNWKKWVREAKEARKIELTEGVGEDGNLTMKQRLQASIDAEDEEDREALR